MVSARRFFSRWLPALIWMAVIFSASSDTGSFQHSSRIIGPVVRWLFPHVSEQQLDTVVLVVRKGAHVTEYAVLSLLFWRALAAETAPNRAWNMPRAALSVLLVALYAASDELHQLFVPHRQASVVDVGIDTAGALLGMALLWSIGKVLKRW